MLLTILTRMSNDEQRVQLLQRLRKKLSNYNLDWLDIRKIISLFSTKDHIRFDILQFLLFYVKNLSKNIEIEDYIDLSNLCTNENELLKIRLFEQIYNRLHIRCQNDLETISNLFQTAYIKQKVEAMIRIHRSNLHTGQQKEITDQQFSALHLTSPSEQTTANNILPPTTTSFLQHSSIAPLKRTYSFDHAYQDQSCHQILTPLLLVQQDEFIQQRDTLLSISMSSSNSSVSSASNENIPIRTRSFMIAIRKTFEHLKETSS